MYEVQLTEEFEAWLAGLRDCDWKPIHGSLSEMRVDYGPGYRLYFVRRGAAIILLVAGGDKSTQGRDIKRATETLDQLDPER